MTDYTKLERIVESNTDVILDMADKVWDWVELGFKERKSSAYEAAVLEKNGFRISDRGIGGIDTSWIATWGQGSPVLGILVEFDGLPDLGNEKVSTKTPREDGVTNGHGCGHNLIGSGAIGAAISLKEHIENEGIPGTIKVYGCPGEELLAGKNYMAKAGAFKGLDAALHIHPGPRNIAFNFGFAAAMDLEIEWEGRAAHAAVAPWEGRSALHAAEIFLISANMMREQILPSCRLHYFIADGGHAVNSIPEHAKVIFRFRGKDSTIVAEGIEWVKDMAKGAALATQTKEKIQVTTGLYDILPNDVLADRVTEHLNRCFPIEWTEEEQAFAKAIQKENGVPEVGMDTTVWPNPMGELNGGSSDVGDVSWNTPTMGIVFATVPLGIGLHTWGVTATAAMSIGHRAVIQAAKVTATTGLDLLTQPDLLEAARAEFDQRTGGKPYKSLNVLDAPPAGIMDDKDRADYECCIHGAMGHFGIKEHGV